MTHKHFIGYGELEAWAKIADKSQPIYALLVSHPNTPDSHGVHTIDQIVFVAQPDGQGLVHYCRLKVTRLTFLLDQPFDPDHERRQQNARDAWAIVHDWLVEQGFQVREAAISQPLNLRYLDGWASFLQYDKETKRYHRTDLVEVPHG